jgi:catechol 2,3-dioxygenase-like lactoylglutathione lyase family enzyme
VYRILPGARGTTDLQSATARAVIERTEIMETTVAVDTGKPEVTSDLPNLGPGIAVPPQKLAHVVFRSPRFEEMVSWYKTVFCAEAAYENEYFSFLSYDDEHHRIAIVNAQGVQDAPKNMTGIHHIAFTYRSLSDLLETYQRLKLLGIPPIVGINHGPTTSIFYADPDGNQLEFQVENFDTLEEACDYFSSDAFAINPIGVDFDPDDLLGRLQAGESEAILKSRPDIGPRAMETYPVQ